mmetsp:Transcript_23342/g.59016  ORF Transcript_23342/g.59016 Transcript_23342/m.59016 type:complete len:261 (-) Transcript_23342:587-1369(-)
MSVIVVIRIDVPAVFIMYPILSSGLRCRGARPSAPASTNMSSTPMPSRMNGSVDVTGVCGTWVQPPRPNVPPIARPTDATPAKASDERDSTGWNLPSTRIAYSTMRKSPTLSEITSPPITLLSSFPIEEAVCTCAKTNFDSLLNSSLTLISNSSSHTVVGLHEMRVISLPVESAPLHVSSFTVSLTRDANHVILSVDAPVIWLLPSRTRLDMRSCLLEMSRLKVSLLPSGVKSIEALLMVLRRAASFGIKEESKRCVSML